MKKLGPKYENYRFCVKKILDDTAIPTDLDYLLRGIRFSYFGKENIRDIADFLSHPNQREQGQTVKKIQNLYTCFLLHLGPGIEKPILIEKVPAIWLDAALASCDLLEESKIKDELKVTRQKAKSMVRKIIKKFSKNQDDTYNGFGISKEELQFISYFASMMPVSAVYSSESLFDDLIYVLKKNHLLKEFEEKKFCLFYKKFSIFCLNAMHLTPIKLLQGKISNLGMTSDQKAGNAVINRCFPITYPTNNGGSITHEIYTTIFETDISWGECVSQISEKGELSATRQNLRTFINIGPDWKIFAATYED